MSTVYVDTPSGGVPPDQLRYNHLIDTIMQLNAIAIAKIDRLVEEQATRPDILISERKLVIQISANLREAQDLLHHSSL